MGLLLSILVTCVGVAELVTLCRNVRRRVTCTNVEGSLAVFHTRQIEELEGIRDNLSKQLQQLRPTLRLNSHEDIEVQFNEGVIARSRSPSPRRFLVSESKHSNNVATRQFVVTEEPQAVQKVQKSKAQECLPEYLIEEETSDRDVPRYVLKDGANPVPLPLPDKFVVSEKEDLEVKSDVFRRKLGHNVVEVDGEIYYERCPSPFPSFDLTVPRNSICSELLDDASVAEVDERSRSSSPLPPHSLQTTQKSGKVDVIMTVGTTAHSSKDYWTNTVLVVPPRKSKSRSTSPALKAANEDGEEMNLEVQSDMDNLGVKKKTGKKKRNKNQKEPQQESSRGHQVRSVSAWLVPFSKPNFTPNQTEKNGLEMGDVDNYTSANFTITEKKTKKVKKVSKRQTQENENEVTETNGTRGGEYIKAVNKDWHGQHFCCWQCDESLTGQRYVLRDDHPYCVSCYESVFANACEKCSRTIGIDSKDLSYKDKHWHEACFLCTTCGESLVDRQFGSKGDRIYCVRCYDEQFASRCDGCHQSFKAGTKKMEYKTRQWHEKCFCCCVCKVPIGTQSFIPREQEIYCAKCYEDKYATRCVKCNGVITSRGVTYKNEPWHRECFTCTHCEKSLAGERFTSRDEKPYCADCFGELFAKRCFACNKPITGIGGTKFISFEDRHWHNDCFFCATCRTSLVGHGFITVQDDIICPDCAKQNLM